MATSLQTLITSTRRYMRDWPDQDALTASVTSSSTTLSVADSTLYYKNEPLQLEEEMMAVRALPSSTSLTVARGMFGSTAASHANAIDILIRPRFWDVEIVDALNAGIDACFPWIYKAVTGDYLQVLANVYEYAVPNMDSPVVPIPCISEVKIKEPGDFAFRDNSSWDISRGATPFIRFKRVPVVGSTIRIKGYGPFPHLAALTDTMDPLWPYRGDNLLVEFAVSRLLMSGEALRVRADTGAIDAREQATRPGASSAASQQALNRFNFLLRQLAMPPLPKTIKSVF